MLTLDAGGTSFRFSAMRGGLAVSNTIVLPSNGDDLQACLKSIVEGFRQVEAKCPAPPVAISFAFPGPADYPKGIIGDLNNLPAFRGGIALGPMLEEKFGIPVFINNDGDLFAYGEAIAGLLPHINDLLEKVGSPKRFKNLIGVPGSLRKICYDPLPRLGVGISRLGTSEAVAIGAYAFALKKLDQF